MWGTDRIERLFDSIMADFPIGSLLYWRLEQKNKDEWPVYEFVRRRILNRRSALMLI